VSRAKGDAAEEKACAFLYENGYVILQRNFYSRFGEIDIIAEKKGTLHFVEVKSAPYYETAVANITVSKLSKIIKTAELYMKKEGMENDYTFDALVVTPDDVTLVEDITI